MKNRSLAFFVLRRCSFTLIAFLLIALALLIRRIGFPLSVHAVSSGIVISQVYGGGGNSGATLKNDFIELFNRGTSTINVTGWTVQYTASTGTTWQSTALSGSIDPGHYYLVQEAQGAGGTTNLPPPDATGTIALSATAGKVALVNNATPLSGACPSSGSLVDLIGFGGANCSEGTGAATLINTTAAIRASNGCTDTDNNASDFSSATPSPRNSASAANTCTAPSNPSGEGAANPASVPAGGTALLTVTVTPGTIPTSTGITVTGNLVPIGESATQAFFDDGSHGDVVAGDRVFSFQATVAQGTSVGAKSLSIRIADAQSRTAGTAIALTVEPPLLAIHDIQGSGNTSPHLGELIATTGIVTALKSNGFFLQTPDSSMDTDPNTSEGIFVFTSTAPPAMAAVGNGVKVTGTVQEFVPSQDPNSPSRTEISFSPTVVLLSSGNALPAPLTLTASDTDPAGSLHQLEKFEGMRVHVDSLTVVSPTQGNVNESSATSSSTGVFFGVITGVARPFREPGIELPDPLPLGAPCCVPRFDGNPERLRVDSNGQTGAPAMEVTSRAVVTNITGVLDYQERTYTLLPDATSPPLISGNVSAAPVSAPAANEFAMASFNLERFFDTLDDPSSSEPVLSASAFDHRLRKASLTVRNILHAPDILGVEEVENLAALAALADQINTDAVAAGDPNPNYQAYLLEGNDSGGIDVGFLVKSARVHVVDVIQAGETETFINPNTLLPETLHDRPPLILRATIQPPVGSPYPVTVIVNHLRSLSGIDDPSEGSRVRAKRRAQAEFLAHLIQTRQAADPDEHLVVVGDFNAFPFNDGYVDVMGTLKGTPTPLNEVVLASSDGVNPDLTNLVEQAFASSAYTFLFGGNAQTLDHLLVTANLTARVTGTQIAHSNADFPESYRNDASRPERVSDHDIPIAYFSFPPAAANLSITQTASPEPVQTGGQLTYSITVSNLGASDATHVVLSDSIPSGTVFVSLSAPSEWRCTTPPVGDNGIISCSTASLSSSGSAFFTLLVKVSCALADAAPLNPTARVSSSTPDSDPDNNSSTTTTVVSNPSPTILAPAAVSKFTGSGATVCGILLSDALIGTATVDDNCPGVTLTRSGVPGDNFFSVGTHTITYRATDSGGSITTTTQTITVSDDTPPILAAPAAVGVATGGDASVCGVSISEAALGTARVSDNCSLVSVARRGVPAGNLFPVGTTVLTYTATDASGNSASATQSVTAVDNTPPTLTCPASTTVEPTTAIGATVTFAPPTVADNCPGATAPSCTPLSGSVFPFGVTSDSCAAKDAAGNSASCSFHVTVTGPKQILQAVLNDLVLLRRPVTPKHDGRKLDRAIEHLTAALDSAHWIDSSHLQPVGGEKVFTEGRITINTLVDLADYNQSALSPTVLLEFVHRIERADRTLAQLAIHEAEVALGDPRHIAAANDRLTSGDSAIKAGNFGRAVEQFRRAWRQALKAVGAL